MPGKLAVVLCCFWAHGTPCYWDNEACVCIWFPILMYTSASLFRNAMGVWFEGALYLCGAGCICS